MEARAIGYLGVSSHTSGNCHDSGSAIEDIEDDSMHRLSSKRCRGREGWCDTKALSLNWLFVGDSSTYTSHVSQAAFLASSLPLYLSCISSFTIKNVV